MGKPKYIEPKETDLIGFAARAAKRAIAVEERQEKIAELSGVRLESAPFAKQQPSWRFKF